MHPYITIDEVMSHNEQKMCRRQKKNPLKIDGAFNTRKKKQSHQAHVLNCVERTNPLFFIQIRIKCNL